MFRINKEMFIQFFIITGGTGGLIYIDPSTLRRTTTVTTTSTPSHDSAVTMTTTASQLARGFGIIIRQIADLLTMLQDYPTY
jgi:E3 ubiquitin-protein ligase EDD1